MAGHRPGGEGGEDGKPSLAGALCGRLRHRHGRVIYDRFSFATDVSLFSGLNTLENRRPGPRFGRLCGSRDEDLDRVSETELAGLAREKTPRVPRSPLEGRDGFPTFLMSNVTPAAMGKNR